MSAVDSALNAGDKAKQQANVRSRLVRRARAHGARREGALLRARRRARREARNRPRRRGDEPRRRARAGRTPLVREGGPDRARARVRRLRALALRAGDRRGARRATTARPPPGPSAPAMSGAASSTPRLTFSTLKIVAGAGQHAVAEREGAQVDGDGARLAGRPLPRRRRRARRDRCRLLEPLSRSGPEVRGQVARRQALARRCGSGVAARASSATSRASSSSG